MARLRNLLANERGGKMTFAQIGRIIGRPVSTAAHSLTISQHPHILAFICMLERLPEEERFRFIREVCRTYPTALHPRLVHSPRAVRILLDTIAMPDGLTVIRGNSNPARTFLLTAIGHTFSQIDQRHRKISGIDIHPPEQFVPVDGVAYLRAELSRDQVTDAVQTMWSDMEKSSAPMVLLNGVWSTMPTMREDILKWTRDRHVIIADAMPPDRAAMAHRGIAPLNILTVSQVKGSGKIRIGCETRQGGLERFSPITM
jgi:hypothetical protein